MMDDVTVVAEVLVPAVARALPERAVPAVARALPESVKGGVSFLGVFPT